MKFFIFLLPVMLCLSSCNGQSSILKKANEVENAITTARPGTVPTSEGSWTMKASIDGKEWTAGSVMPPRVAGRIVGYYKTGYIAMPYDDRSMTLGKKIKITEDNVIDVSLGDDADFWSGKDGELEITKVDGEWVEGKFHFSATARTKTNILQVTNGFFRISVK